MTHQLLEYIEQTLMPKLDNNEYLQLTTMIKTIHDHQHPTYEILIEELNEYLPDQISESIEGQLSHASPDKLPLEMLRAINDLCIKNKKLDNVILNLAKLHSDLLCRYEQVSDMYHRRQLSPR
jgi:hypothetical protein